jgi:hypothetical protein
LKKQKTYLFEFGTIGADDHQVIPDFPVVVIALDGLLKNLPGPGFLSKLDVRI